MILITDRMFDTKSPGLLTTGCIALLLATQISVLSARVPDWINREDAPEAAAWEAEQTARTQAAFNQSPLRPYILRQFRRWSEAPQETYRQVTVAQSNVFALAKMSASTPAVLIRFPRSELTSNRLSQATILLDPAKLDVSGLTEIRWFSASPNSTTLAVMLHRKGETWGKLRFVATVSGAWSPDVLEGVESEPRPGSVAWTADTNTLLYTRYATLADGNLAPAARRLEIWSHRAGADQGTDTRENLPDIPAGMIGQLKSSWDGRWIALTLRSTQDGSKSHWIRNRSGSWRLLAGTAESIDQLEFGRPPAYIELPADHGVYLLSRRGTPRGRILRTAPNALSPIAQAEEIIPESRDNNILSFVTSSSGLYLSLMRNGATSFVFCDRMEKEPLKSAVALPIEDPGTVGEFLVSRGDELLYRTESFTDPSAWFLYDPLKDRTKAFGTPLTDLAQVDFRDAQTDRIRATSADGTRVTVLLVRRKGAVLDGSIPVVLSVQGSEGALNTPIFDARRKLWLDQGGAYAFAMVRGGGEMGAEWRAAGRGLRGKLKSLEDLTACANILIRSNYTQSHLLCIAGEDYGASLATLAIARHPQLFHSAILKNGPAAFASAGQLRRPESWDDEYGIIESSQALEITPWIAWQASGSRPAVLLRSSGPGSRFSPVHFRRWMAESSAEGAMSGSRSTLATFEREPAPNAKADLEMSLDETADTHVFLFDQLNAEYSLIRRGPWSGGITHTSAVVKVLVSEPGMAVRLGFSPEPSLRDARYALPTSSGTQSDLGLVEFRPEGLAPNVNYHYVVEVNGRMDWQTRGRFRTFPLPESQSSFRIAFASCAKTGSANSSFDRIREAAPLFFLHMGDFHYQNIAVNEVGRFRDAYGMVLGSLPQARLYRTTPIVYMWDDHDSGGNNSDKKSSSHPAARQAYEEFVPHYPLSPGPDEPIHQAFTVGRIRFLITDLRSERDDVKKKDNAEKSLLGEKQKSWLKQQLLASKGVHPVICWMTTVPWLGTASSNYYAFIKGDQFGWFHHESPAARASTKSATASGEDHWALYTSERREIADFIKSNAIREVIILHGDSHMLAADDGRNGDYATDGGAPMRVMCAGPLDQTPSIKGGPYSQGVYKVRAGEGCFGLLDFEDIGSTIRVSYSGRNNLNEEKISLKFEVPIATTPSRSRP